jgi:drug/metabolite transporter (DMT)-like permease
MTALAKPVRTAPSPELSGFGLGLAAAAIWGLLQASGRLAALEGLSPFDLAALRFGTAGVILLPWVLRHSGERFAGIGLARAGILALLIGPLFFMANMGGYLFAPLAHGAVILPASFTVFSLILAAWLFDQRLSSFALVGVAMILIGVAVIAGPSALHFAGMTWLGDLMFAVGALMWAGATMLVRRWGISPIQTTASVAVLSAALYLPAYLGLTGAAHLLAANPAHVLFQAIVTGIFAGIFAVLAFTRSVELLGPARAAIWPALVPVFAIIAGVPLTGELPMPLQFLGLAIATTGLIVAARRGR